LTGTKENEERFRRRAESTKTIGNQCEKIYEEQNRYNGWKSYV